MPLSDATQISLNPPHSTLWQINNTVTVTIRRQFSRPPLCAASSTYPSAGLLTPRGSHQHWQSGCRTAEQDKGRRLDVIAVSPCENPDLLRQSSHLPCLLLSESERHDARDAAGSDLAEAQIKGYNVNPLYGSVVYGTDMYISSEEGMANVSFGEDENVSRRDGLQPSPEMIM